MSGNGGPGTTILDDIETVAEDLRDKRRRLTLQVHRNGCLWGLGLGLALWLTGEATVWGAIWAWGIVWTAYIRGATLLLRKGNR